MLIDGTSYLIKPKQRHDTQNQTQNQTSMKKYLMIFLVLFLGTELTYGQLTLGIKAGYTASKLSSDLDTIKSTLNSGFHIGAFARIGKRIYVQPEFYYNLSGATFKISNKWEQKVKVGSLDIPVLLGIKVIDTKLVNWRIMAGPEISFVVNKKVKNVSLTGPITTDNVNKVNWYLQAGTGVDVLFLTLDIRYQLGLNNFINDVKTQAGSTTTKYPLNSKSSMWVVSLGWKIM